MTNTDFSSSTVENGMSPLEWVTFFGKQRPGLWAKTDTLRAQLEKGDQGWPAPGHLYLPLAAIEWLIAQSGAPLDINEPKQNIERYILSLLAAWRVTKGIYRFDETVYEEVCRTPIKGELPGQLLQRLPEWTVYVETPGKKFGSHEIHGFFAAVSDAGGEGDEWLVMLLNCGEFLHFAPIPIGNRPLDIEVAEAVKNARELGLEEESSELTEQSRLVAELVSLLLYLCSEASEVGDGVKRPSKPVSKKVKKAARMFPAERTVKWDVAVRLGAALRRANSEPDVSFTGTGSSKRPHIRTAHWHTYLEGPGKTIRTLKWQRPIPVKCESPDDLVATVRPVE